MFLALASHLTDEAKLDRMVPFIIELLHDEAALVKVGAIRCLMQVVSAFDSSEIKKDDSILRCVIAHVSNGDHTLQRVHLPGIYHTQYQASST